MFKFEAFVLVLVMSLVSSGQTANAKDDPTYDFGGALSKCLDKPDADQQACIDKVMKVINATKGSSGDCADIGDRLNKASHDLDDACGKTAIGEDCVTAFSKCKPVGASAKKGGSKNGLLDVDAEDAKNKACPAMSSADLKTYEDKADKLQEKIDKMKDDLPKLQESLANARKDGQDKIDDKQKEQAQNQADYTKELAQIGKDKSAKDKEIAGQITQLQGEIGKAEDGLRQVDQSVAEAGAKLSDAKTQIDINCQSQASNQVAAIQTQVIPLIKTNSWNRGSQKQFLKQVGLTDRQSWQRIAYQRYLWCIHSGPTVAAQKQANTVYQLAISNANKQKVSIKNQETLLQNQIKQLVDTKACNPQAVTMANGTSGGESQSCANAQEAKAAGDAATAAYNAKQAPVSKAIASATQGAAADYDAKQKSAAAKEQAIQDEQKRLDNLQDFLDAKYSNGASASSDAKSLQEAKQRYSALKRVAEETLKCTHDKASENTEPKLHGKDLCSSSPCSTAKDFLKVMYGDNTSVLMPSTIAGLTLPAQPPPAAAPSGTTTAPAVNTPSTSGAASSRENGT